MTNDEQILAPFTDEQVKSLNEFQEFMEMHPYTCGNDSGHQKLVAETKGWKCLDCTYTQNWAHKWVVEWNWKIGRMIKDD